MAWMYSHIILKLYFWLGIVSLMTARMTVMQWNDEDIGHLFYALGAFFLSGWAIMRFSVRETNPNKGMDYDKNGGQP